ncbi:MAG: hypothetical protein H7235_03670 [Bdellovibrionaceae bacterium]|nr:hypothetical protein [Pseudobdellovibrionaceae bacterium]
MKNLSFLMLVIGVFLTQMNVYAEDCLQQPNKNCVDLCKVDPGNVLNRRIESRVKISERQSGSCRISDHGESYLGDKVSIDYNVVYFEVCRDLRYERIETVTLCN